MARPKKQTVVYFPHDTDASDRRTLTIIQAKYGNDGYAFWFKLLQLLGKSPGLYYDYNNVVDLEFLCAKTHQKNTETIIDMLNTLATLEAIDKELHQCRIIWSPHLVERVADAFDRTVDGLPQRPEKRVNVENNTKVSTETHRKDTETTQTKLKENKRDQKKLYIELPGWINKETWDAFLEMRKKTKAPPTDRAKDLLIMELEKLKTAGNDPNSVLEQSIMNNWKGVFALKGGQNGIHQKHSNLTKHYTDPDAWLRQRQAESDSPTGAGQ